ncbi:hypothetical protein AGR6A_Lc50020 [Agrobacterium sp. NCPPB 925]|nr:hypothetical protein AGR6A_Lc50020 [Agrobacterium sp. NCPPB 925]
MQPLEVAIEALAAIDSRRDDVFPGAPGKAAEAGLKADTARFPPAEPLKPAPPAPC